MNIAIFTDTYYPDTNGIAVASKILVDTLKAHGHNVMVVTTSREDGNHYEDGVIYTYINRKPKHSFFKSLRRFNKANFKMIRDFNPDIIHNQTNDQVGQFGRYTANKLNKPFVYTYHIHYEDYAPYAGGGFFHRLFRARERAYFKHMMNISTEFIAPTIKIKNYLRKKGVDKYINVITTGVDPSTFIIDEEMKQKGEGLKEKFKIEKDEKIGLYVGNLSREKNIDLLIKSYKRFIDSNPKHKCRLIIVGKGEEANELALLVRQLGLDKYIHFAGKVGYDIIRAYYGIADFYMSCSTSETQNITIMEAMLTKTIVLAKNDESLIGFIDENKTGFTFNDSTQFVYQLNRLLDMDKKEIEEIKNNSYKKIVEECSLEKFYQNIYEVYIRAERKNW